MNKKKAVYTSLTALALASFSATTFADEVNTATEEVSVTLADEAVAETTALETSTEVAATETVAEEEPVAVTALIEDTAVTANAEQREAINAGDFTSLTGTWETADGTALSVNENGLLSTVANPTPFEPKISSTNLMVLLTGENSKDIHSVGYNYVATEDLIIYYPNGRSYGDYNEKQVFDEVHAGNIYRKVSALPTTYKVTDLSAYTNFEVFANGNVGDQTIAEYWNSLPTDDVRKTNKQIDILTLYLDSGEKVELVLDPSRDSLDKLVETLDLTGWGGASSSFSIGENEYGTLFYRHYKVGNLPEVVDETTPVTTDVSDINAQIREGNTQAIAGTWQTETGELISISADNKLFSITYPEGHRLDPIGKGESVEWARLTETGNLLLPNLGLGVYEPNLSLTKFSDEETTFDKTYWAWTGLENFTYDWSVNSLQLGMEAGEKGGHYHVFSGDYNGVPYELVYFRDTTNQGAPQWSDFNLPDDIKPVGLGSGPNIYYYALPSGYIPVLKSDVSETITLTDDKNSGVTVELSSDEGATSLDVTEHIEPTEVNPVPIARLEGLDYDLYDITLKDAQGNPITTLKAAAIVKLPVDEGKTVERVIYLPENGDAETLAILKQENGFVYFETNHFSHYGVVYALVTSPEEETKDVATTRNELLLTLDASGLTDAQKSDLAEKIAFAETAEELAGIQAEVETLIGAGGAASVADKSEETTSKTSDKAVSTTAKGAGQVAASSTSTPSYSRVERAAEKSLPKTGEATSVLGLIGLGLTTLGTVVSKRRNI